MEGLQELRDELARLWDHIRANEERIEVVTGVANANCRLLQAIAGAFGNAELVPSIRQPAPVVALKVVANP